MRSEAIYFICKATGYNPESISKLTDKEIAFIVAALEVRNNG